MLKLAAASLLWAAVPSVSFAQTPAPRPPRIGQGNVQPADALLEQAIDEALQTMSETATLIDIARAVIATRGTENEAAQRQHGMSPEAGQISLVANTTAYNAAVDVLRQLAPQLVKTAEEVARGRGLTPAHNRLAELRKAIQEQVGDALLRQNIEANLEPGATHRAREPAAQRRVETIGVSGDAFSFSGPVVGGGAEHLHPRFHEVDDIRDEDGLWEVTVGGKTHTFKHMARNSEAIAHDQRAELAEVAPRTKEETARRARISWLRTLIPHPTLDDIWGPLDRETPEVKRISSLHVTDARVVDGVVHLTMGDETHRFLKEDRRTGERFSLLSFEEAHPASQRSGKSTELFGGRRRTR